MDDLKLIKKHYGENMMHLCRESFPTLLETEGLLWFALTKKFPYSKNIADDIIEMNAQNEFKNIIYEEINVKDNDKIVVNKTPKELLYEAGYILYECKTEEEINKFKKYYAPGEVLCTFNENRLNRCYVFFAVKKNVDEIKRENFKNPDRQDEYGTSVISIQFTRDDSNTLSIKNRYNHTVNYPDSTFSNNLDNIIPGLTEAFNNTYGLNCNNKNTSRHHVPMYYVPATNGKYYKSIFEKDNVHYCVNNVILDNFNAHELDKSKYIVMDNYILNLQTKKIYSSYEEYLKSIDTPEYGSNDSFIKSIGEIKDIKINHDRKTQNKTIIINGNIEILLNNHNRMIKYKNENVKEIGDFFLEGNCYLQEIELPNVETIRSNFLLKNTSIVSIDFPNLKKIGDKFLQNNNLIRSINLPNVEEIGSYFLPGLNRIESISLPKVVDIGNEFLARGDLIRTIDMPNIKYIGGGFLHYNQCLEGKLYLPNLVSIGGDFLAHNNAITSIDFPKLEYIRKDFMCENRKVEYMNLPNITIIGDSFMRKNIELDDIIIPKVKLIGKNFMDNNKHIKNIELPKLEELGNNFLGGSAWLSTLKMPNLKPSQNYDTIYDLTLFLNDCLMLNELDLSDEIVSGLKAGKLKEEIINLLDIPKTR